jgi:hypothetical protein
MKEDKEEDKEKEDAPVNPSAADQTSPLLDLEKTGSQKLFNDIILTYFIPLEIWYTRTIIDKVGNPQLKPIPPADLCSRHIGCRVQMSPKLR